MEQDSAEPPVASPGTNTARDELTCGPYSEGWLKDWESVPCPCGRLVKKNIVGEHAKSQCPLKPSPPKKI